MRQVLTTALELIGAASMVVGAGLAYLPAGFLVGGAFAVAAGYLVADDT
jgi:hypothetical protein